MIAIVDSGGANVASVRFALDRLGIPHLFTADAEDVRKASHVILPGVGAAAAAMKRLNDNGLIECLRSLTQPVMGICLGMQILFRHSEEGYADCLNLMDGDVRRFSTQALPIPHMGWNTVRQTRPSPIFRDVNDDDYFYFVHSYRAPIGGFTVGASEYGESFSAAVEKDNLFGCQFHPERSGKAGARILGNFARL